MLFTCNHCKIGFSALHVECFHSNKKNKYIYLCEKHISHRNPDMVHEPWMSSYDGICNVCHSTGDKCAGIHLKGVCVHGTKNNFAISKLQS